MQDLRYEKFHNHSCTNLGKYGMHFKLKIPYLLSPKGTYLFSSLLILTTDEITCYNYMILIIIFIFVNVTLHLQLSREGIPMC